MPILHLDVRVCALRFRGRFWGLDSSFLGSLKALSYLVVFALLLVILASCVRHHGICVPCTQKSSPRLQIAPMRNTPAYFQFKCGVYSRLLELELALELIQTQITKKPSTNAEKFTRAKATCEVLNF
jgi:hypothetical protein